MDLASRLWVIDTSSIIAVRREPFPPGARKKVFAALGKLVTDNLLVYPREVLDELARTAGTATPDPQYQWAKDHHELGCRHKTDLAGVKEVLARVPRVVDAQKTSPTTDADPYVVALAIHLRDLGGATVVTEDRKDSPIKMSLTTACGLWGVPAVPLVPFLELLKIWP